MLRFYGSLVESILSQEFVNKGIWIMVFLAQVSEIPNVGELMLASFAPKNTDVTKWYLKKRGGGGR